MTDALQDEDTNTEVDIDEEEKQWAYALAKENLLDSYINEQLILVDILSKLKEENKTLGKLFKNKKKNNIVICPNLSKNRKM